ncbi:MAG: HAD-IIIA family hydrolase [Alphaproteobacteria bacterium]|nr:HAD-IIIA family hydrolase [Alphaproteobacteria bacterium]
MKTVIMAGGKGTRISAVRSDIPKPLIEIDGVPVLEREICCLRDQGFDEFILTVGHMADRITEYFGNGKKLNVTIEYFVETRPLGNAGALLQMRERLTEDFLLLNGDAVFDVDFGRFADFHRKKGGIATLFTHPNDHPYDSALIVADKNDEVQKWLAKEDDRPLWYRNRVNAGLHILNPAALDMNSDLLSVEKVDLDRHILKPLCGTGKMFCYDSPEYVKDMGTPERFLAVCNDFRSGMITAKNLRHKQKAVFLDRDGTLNKSVGFLKDINDFELLPDVPEAIRMINASGYLAVVVTNQPVIARGELSEVQLREIHNKMETLLGREGAYLDAIFYCPHHPDKGFEGEIAELKIECNCRKPKPGLLLKAAEKFNIDLAQSWIVGDFESDIKAGKAAGCRTALIGNGKYGQDMTADSLSAFTKCLLKI